MNKIKTFRLEINLSRLTIRYIHNKYEVVFNRKKGLK